MASINSFLNKNDIESNKSKFDNSRITIAEVMDTRSFSRSGDLKVWIPGSRIPKDDSSRWITARYASPFYGTSSPSRTYQQSFSAKAKSYGMFFVPPDIGNTVFVFFPNIYGENSLCYWFACPVDPELSSMIPGIPYDSETQKPVIEKTSNIKNNTKDKEVADNSATPYTPLDDAFQRQGLSEDLLRGPASSGIKRESPSRVYGILTPYGNQFVLDDGWNQNDNLDNWDNANAQQAQDLNEDLNVERYDSGIRLRTRDGVQILLSNNKGHVYMINRDGTAWAELNNDGYVDCWALKCVSAASDGDINLKANRNINISADGTINIKAGGDIKLEATNLTAQMASNILASSGANTEISATGAVLTKAEGNIESTSSASVMTSAGTNIESTAGATILSNGGSSIEMKTPKTIVDSADISLGGVVAVKDSLNSPSIDVNTLTGDTVTASTGFKGQLTGNATTATWAASADAAGVSGEADTSKGSSASVEYDASAGDIGEFAQPQEITAEVTKNVHSGLNDIQTTIVSRLPSAEPYYYHLNDDQNDTVQQPIVQQYKSYQISNDGKAPVKEDFPTVVSVDYVTKKEDVPEDLQPDFELIDLKKDDQFSVFEKSFQEVMLAEGGYCNHPADKGGPTKWGVSQRAYPNLDIKNLTLDDAKEIYRRDYWNKCGADKLPEGVAVMAADLAYNSGVSRSIKLMQRTCGLPESGKLDSVTLAKIKSSDIPDYMAKFKTVRMNFLKSLSNWNVFGRGWTNRVNKNYAFGVAINKLVNSEEVTTV